MKVLFLSVSTGHGHNQTAYAVMDCLKEKNVEYKMVDIYEYINPILSDSIAKGYLISTKFTPAVYGRLYRLAEKMENMNKKYSINSLVNSMTSRKLESLIKEYNPDVIVCTHIFAAQNISRIKISKGLSAYTIGIVTDFTIHPFWEETVLDCYITANEILNNQIKKKGISVEKVKALGIPINSKFSIQKGKSQARKELGFEERPSICMMGGSMGYGNVVPLIKKIDKLESDLQIICICGNNKNLKGKVEALKTSKNVYTFGFIDFVDKIMDASDCIITKPGGLTVSESLAKELPMILFNPIPGQEDRNVEFLINNGLAIKISSTYPVDEAIFQLMYSDFRINHLKEAIAYFRKPNASEDLSEFIINIIKK